MIQQLVEPSFNSNTFSVYLYESHESLWRSFGLLFFTGLRVFVYAQLS